MTEQWILVADASRARIFSRGDDHRGLECVDTLEHPQSRAHEGDLRTGGKGTSHDQAGEGERQSDPQTTTMEKHAEIFAREIAERLKSGFNDAAFRHLVLVAEPDFLGRLREQIDAPMSRTITHTIDRNWTKHDRSRIAKQLDRQLGN